jgi:hypothetical protein
VFRTISISSIAATSERVAEVPSSLSAVVISVAVVAVVNDEGALLASVVVTVLVGGYVDFLLEKLVVVNVL